jgi:hypothetical protein
VSLTNYGELKTAVANWLKRGDLTSRIPEFIALAEDRINKKLRVRAMEASATLVLSATTTVDTVGGTGDVITLTPGTAATAYTTGDRYQFDAAATNTGATTVNVSGLGAKAITKRENGTNTALESDDMVIGKSYVIAYDGTQFQLVLPGAYLLPSRYVGKRRLYLDGTEKKVDFFPSSSFWTRNAVNESGRPKIYTIEGDYMVFAPVPDTAITGRLLYYRGFAALSADGDTNWIFSNARAILLYGALVEASPFIGNDNRTMTWATLFEQAFEDAQEADKAERIPYGPVEARSEVDGP